MKKQIKESIDELYKEQLCQQNSIKSKKRPIMLPIIVTLVLSAAIVLFTVIQLPKSPHPSNEEVISNGNNQASNSNEEATQDFREVSSTVKKNGTVIFYNENDIQYLEEEFQQAEKVAGLANMATPQFEIMLGEDGELFFLWFNEDHSATLMEAKNTYVIYKIRSAEKIEKMVQESLAFAHFMANIKWESGVVSMVKPFNLTFTYASIRYQLWLNEEHNTVTLVPIENNANRWASLNEADSATLMKFLETNNRESSFR
ncbi:MAG: hypothetical protein RR651_07095 [Lysinibacillus sp.]